MKLNNDALLDAIGSVREDYIAEADASPTRRIRKFPVVLAAVLLCMALTVSALAAADVEPVYNFLYALSPELALTLKPVRMSCVDNGIELEVISADVEGDTARIFLGLRDLEGNRVDETTDLFDSYRIHMSSDLVATCSFAAYDPVTGQAQFLVEITRGDGKPIRKDKITFSMDRFISGKQEFVGPLELDLSSAEMQPATQTDVIPRGYGWTDESYADFTLEKYLLPSELLSPMEDISITGMGWVDGYLHIQTHYADILKTDAHGGVYLKDASGNNICDVFEVSFWDKDNSGSSYSEQIFDITPEEAADCRLFGQFYSADMLTEGHWEITFSLDG